MNNKTIDEKIVTKEDLEVLEERIFHYEINKKIGTVDKMVPGAVKENEAIKHLLAEREQKDKRIKELEEENYIQRRQLNDAFMRGFIHKDKVKEALEYIEDYFDRLNGPDVDIEYIRKAKQELLEGEK